jgi:hypothetical protein
VLNNIPSPGNNKYVGCVADATVFKVKRLGVEVEVPSYKITVPAVPVGTM